MVANHKPQNDRPPPQLSVTLQPVWPGPKVSQRIWCPHQERKLVALGPGNPWPGRKGQAARQALVLPVTVWSVPSSVTPVKVIGAVVMVRAAAAVAAMYINLPDSHSRIRSAQFRFGVDIIQDHQSTIALRFR